MSKDALQKDKLLILIHGNGVVRAGQWARRYVMLTSIDLGVVMHITTGTSPLLSIAAGDKHVFTLS